MSNKKIKQRLDLIEEKVNNLGATTLSGIDLQKVFNRNGWAKQYGTSATNFIVDEAASMPLVVKGSPSTTIIFDDPSLSPVANFKRKLVQMMCEYDIASVVVDASGASTIIPFKKLEHDIVDPIRTKKVL